MIKPSFQSHSQSPHVVNTTFQNQAEQTAELLTSFRHLALECSILSKIVLRKLFNIFRNRSFFSWCHPGVLDENHLLSYVISTRDALVENHLLSYNTGTRNSLAAGLTADQ